MSAETIEGGLADDFSRYRSYTLEGVVFGGNFVLNNPKREPMVLNLTAGRVVE